MLVAEPDRIMPTSQRCMPLPHRAPLKPRRVPGNPGTAGRRGFLQQMLCRQLGVVPRAFSQVHWEARCFPRSGCNPVMAAAPAAQGCFPQGRSAPGRAEERAVGWAHTDGAVWPAGTEGRRAIGTQELSCIPTEVMG